MLVVGIDPTTLSRSALGFSVVDFEDSNNPKIVFVSDLPASKEKELKPRLKQVVAFTVKHFKQLELENKPYMIAIETTVMAGVGGQSLQRAIGAIITLSPTGRKIKEVYPMQVKKFITGVGKSGDKKAVAEGLKKFFKDSRSLEILFQLTTSSRWDIIDSIAIAFTGWEICAKEFKIIPNTKSKSAIKKGLA